MLTTDFTNINIERRRVFLLEILPEGMTRADEHLQIFDNYLTNTSLRLRTIRVPQTKEWTWLLQKSEPLEKNDLSILACSEIKLDEYEHQVLEVFEGNEIRKNRYFYELSGRKFEIDLFIGNLWGVILAQTFFQNNDELKTFEKPEFAFLDVTNESFFTGKNLYDKKFEDVKNEIERIMR